MKECPFCGSRPEYICDHADGYNKVYILKHKENCYFNIFGKSNYTFYSEEEETQLWNTRSIQQERREKLNNINDTR